MPPRAHFAPLNVRQQQRSVTGHVQDFRGLGTLFQQISRLSQVRRMFRRAAATAAKEKAEHTPDKPPLQGATLTRAECGVLMSFLLASTLLEYENWWKAIPQEMQASVLAKAQYLAVPNGTSGQTIGSDQLADSVFFVINGAATGKLLPGFAAKRAAAMEKATSAAAAALKAVQDAADKKAAAAAAADDAGAPSAATTTTAAPPSAHRAAVLERQLEVRKRDVVAAAKAMAQLQALGRAAEEQDAGRVALVTGQMLGQLDMPPGFDLKAVQEVQHCA